MRIGGRWQVNRSRQEAIGAWDRCGKVTGGDEAPGRDRDESGRARNARPRDGLGRPLAYGSSGVPTMPEDLLLSDSESVSLAQDLLDSGRPFHAHEVLEARWKTSHDPVARAVWQGLAQLAVGLTHEARGNSGGARSLIQRGRDRLAGIPANSSATVDLPGVVSWADGWLAFDRDQPLRLTPRVGTGP